MGRSPKRKQLLMRDLNGFLYLVPVKTAEKWRIAPDDLPAVLERVSQEIPEIDWKARMKKTKAVPALAVEAGVSFAGSVAANVVVNKVHECCVIDCCVSDCCVSDCPSDSCPRYCMVDGPGCRPVR